MPYEIRETNGKFCLHKKGDDAALNCHGTREEAMAQMQAIMANESKAFAVKFVAGTDDTIEGILMPFGGLFQGRDLDGEYFSAKTNFCLEWFPEGQASRPLLFDHGLDPEAGPSVVGRIKSINIKSDSGGWMQAQLDKQSKYFAAIKELVEKGKLFLSSGAMAHLVQKAASGELLRWPVVEGSLTPTPANLLATVGFPEVAKHYKSIGIDLPESLKLSSADMPEDDEMRGRMVQKKPAKMMMSKPQMRKLAKEMASEMGVEMSGDEMDAMMDQMPAEMEESEAKEKMRAMMRREKNKSANLLDLIETTEFSNVPLADQAEGLNIIAASLFERTKDLNQRRVKEGRILSTANRKRLRESIAAMRQAMEETCAWLDSTEPQPEGKTADVRRLQTEIYQTYIAANAS